MAPGVASSLTALTLKVLLRLYTLDLLVYLLTPDHSGVLGRDTAPLHPAACHRIELD